LALALTGATTIEGQVRLALGEPRDMTASFVLMGTSGLAVGSDGAIVVTDRYQYRMTKVSPEGEVIWHAGRRGEGPGEFRSLSRVGILPDGRIIVHDLFADQISWFDGDGDFIRRAKLPMRLDAVGDMIVLGGGEIAISGVPREGRTGGIWVFAATENEPIMTEVRSFGPLPPARTYRSLEYWGSGALEMAGDGSLLYALKIPYEIHHFRRDGTSLGVIDREYEFTAGPDDHLVEQRAGERMRLSLNWIPFPLPAHDLGDGYILSGVITDEDGNGIWDVFHEGSLVLSMPAPEGNAFVTEVDRERGYLYTAGSTGDDERAFFQIPYEIRGS
jgi:hypothetical protein